METKLVRTYGFVNRLMFEDDGTFIPTKHYDIPEPQWIEEYARAKRDKRATKAANLSLKQTSEFAIDKFTREEQCRDFLERRQPDTWAKVIKRIPNDIRADIARIIWWDWFSLRDYSDRWSHLDSYLDLKPNPAATQRRICNALMRCGYSPRAAYVRAGFIIVQQPGGHTNDR